MFATTKQRSSIGSALNMSRLIFHSVVRKIRQSHRVPLMSIFSSILQTVMFVLAFLLMFDMLGMRGTAIRGDFVLYIMSGIFLFQVHTQSVGAVSGAESSASPMMQHAPMNTIISICAAAISSLYTQVIALSCILLVYYVGIQRFEIHDPIGCLGMVLLAWGSGCAIGLAVYAFKPWAPGFVGIISTVYQRANMLASGKMFVANTLPTTMLAMFDWNPLFHVIDQARGYTFINYMPRNSTLEYPLKITLAFVFIGLIVQYYTNKRVSDSWSARD